MKQVPDRDALRMHLSLLVRRLRLSIRAQSSGMRASNGGLVSTKLSQRRRTPMFTRLLCGVAFAALSVSAASADDLSTVLITTDKSKVTLVFDRALPNVPAKV